MKPQPLPDSDESYKLTVDANGVNISANTRFGALRAMETLLQLMQNGAENTSIPWVTIEDSPRFPWRGLLLDSARHFLPIPDIKRQIDGMAAAKLNVLHWHLTDDQGWRFSSKRYPKLTQLASDGLFYTLSRCARLCVTLPSAAYAWCRKLICRATPRRLPSPTRS